MTSQAFPVNDNVTSHATGLDQLGLHLKPSIKLLCFSQACYSASYANKKMTIVIGKTAPDPLF